MRIDGGVRRRGVLGVIALVAAIPILELTAVSCGHGNGQGQPAAAEPFSYDQRIGWLHGRCLAISNPKLVTGTPVAVIIAGEPQRIEQARIQQPTDSSTTCSALLPPRAKSNATPGTTFYALDASKIEPTDLGFGIVSPPAQPEVVNGVARIDLNRNGHPVVFASCSTSEGIKFTAWTDKAYQGEPRWSKYYYMGYDLTPNCP